jgi:hypothetical protein
MSNDKSKFYDNDPRRDHQPGRVSGGNVDADQTEKHGQKRGMRIAQGGSGGADGVSTGSNKTFGMQRECGGNKPAELTREQHASDRENMGREFVSHNNGRANAKHSSIPSEFQTDDRGLDASGNDDNGGREKSGQKKAERLDMSVERFHRIAKSLSR